MEMEKCVTVYDKYGKLLTPCTKKVAWVLVNRNRAVKLDDNTIKIILDKKDIKKIKKKIIERDGRVCIYCGRYIPEDEIATADHLNPRHITDKGDCGYDTEENMACSCLECNGHKGNMGFEEYVIFRLSILLAYARIVAKIPIEEPLNLCLEE